MPAGPSIGVIAPTVEIASRTRDVARELDMADMVSVRVGFHIDGVDIARRYVEEGVDVLVSRRGTSVLIDEQLDVPNVSLPVTLEDLALALNGAREITGLSHPRVGVFAMPDVQADVEAFAKYLKFDLRTYKIMPDEDYLSYMVDRAIADKMDVIVAGTVVTVFANQRGIASVLMDSGPVSLRNALREARRIAYGRKLEQTRAEHFRIAVDASTNGILILDAEQNIHVANPMALGILQKKSIEQGSNVARVLPELDLSLCYAKGEKIENQLLASAGGPMILNVTPTLVGSRVRGAVISFQLAESVTELGASTRHNLYGQGFSSLYSFSFIVGESACMQTAKSKARAYAARPGAILLVGETGTGKELFAHAIHKASACSHGPFIPVNCAAIPSSLLESELFGYEEGAFTGAVRRGKPGLFELAHQGSLFLDEISELSKQAQLRLLRVLQERSVIRLGGRRLIPVDVRIIAATNKNLHALVNDGKFRKDLFYRLTILPLFIPPLCERYGDIALLAEHFLRQGRALGGVPKTLAKRHLKALESHSWPGNVRELQNVMERFVTACGMGEQPDMDVILAPEREWGSLCKSGPLPTALPTARQRERERIELALRQSNGRRGEAARVLGINRTTLFRKMSLHGML